uniref:Unannotated protein n=1 Tax=freshwater metagenome TaxID=449393 RepID=A0A6J5ZM70_9ZZZZ
MKSGCSLSNASGGQIGSAAASASSQITSRPSVISNGVPAWRTTKIVSSESMWSSAPSTSLLIGVVLPLRAAPSTVISAFACENSIRSRTESTLKPPKTTLCGAPMRAQASIATTTSGIIGR